METGGRWLPYGPLGSYAETLALLLYLLELVTRLRGQIVKMMNYSLDIFVTMF